MQIDGPRALVLRLIMGEVLARPGEGPLARRPLARRRATEEVGDAPAVAHGGAHGGAPEPGEREP